MLGGLLALDEDIALVAECHNGLETVVGRLARLGDQVPRDDEEREAIVVIGADAEELGGEYVRRAERDGRRVRIYTRGRHWSGSSATVMRIGGVGPFGWPAGMRVCGAEKGGPSRPEPRFFPWRRPTTSRLLGRPRSGLRTFLKAGVVVPGFLTGIAR